MHNVWKHNLRRKITNIYLRYSMICLCVCTHIDWADNDDRRLCNFIYTTLKASHDPHSCLYCTDSFISLFFFFPSLHFTLSSETRHNIDLEKQTKNKRIGWKCQLSHSWDKVNIWFGFILSSHSSVKKKIWKDRHISISSANAH